MSSIEETMKMWQEQNPPPRIGDYPSDSDYEKACLVWRRRYLKRHELAHKDFSESEHVAQPAIAANVRRQYALHAPEMIPDWFTTSSTKPPPEPYPNYKQALPIECHSEYIKALRSSIDLDKTSIEVQEYFRGHEEHAEKVYVHNQKEAEHRYFKWRWYYADKMIEMEGAN